MSLIFATKKYDKLLLNLKLSPHKEGIFQSKFSYLRKIIAKAEQELKSKRFPAQNIWVHILSHDYNGESSAVIFFDGERLLGREPFTNREVDVISILRIFIH